MPRSVLCSTNELFMNMDAVKTSQHGPFQGKLPFGTSYCKLKLPAYTVKIRSICCVVYYTLL